MSGILFEPLTDTYPAVLSAAAKAHRATVVSGLSEGGAVLTGEAPVGVSAFESIQPTELHGAASPARVVFLSGASTALLCAMPAGQASMDATATVEVDLTLVQGYQPVPRAAGVTGLVAKLEMAAQLSAQRSRLVSGADTVMHGDLPAGIATFVSMTSGPTGSIAFVSHPGAAWIVAGEGQQITTASAVDSLAISVDPITELIHVIVEQIRLSGAFDTLVEQLLTVRDGITLSDAVRAITALHLSDTVQLGEKVTVTPELAVQLVDALLLASPASSVHEINALVSTVLALLDAGADLHLALAEDGIELGDAVLYQARAYVSAIEELRLSGVANWSVVLVVTAQDAVSLSDSGVHFAEIAALVRSGVALLAHVSLADAPQIAWVMNTESRAVFTYDQWPFNSYAEFGGRHLAAGPDGIYLLAGDTDAGVPILAKVRTGLMDMGTSAKKRIESMYLGYSADGRMGLRVITTMPSGEKRAHDYVMKLRPADAATTNRIKIGRGHASRYYAFELSNVDGSDFTLNGAELLPMILDRRI